MQKEWAHSNKSRNCKNDLRESQEHSKQKLWKNQS